MRRPAVVVERRLLFAGKMTIEDVQDLEPLFADGTLAGPRWLPHWVARANGLAGVLAFSLFANRIRLDQITDSLHLADV